MTGAAVFAGVSSPAAPIFAGKPMTLNDLSGFLQRKRKKILLAILILLVGGGALLFWQSSTKNGEPDPTNGEEGEVPTFSFAGDTWKISGQINLGKLGETRLPQETVVYKVREQKEH